MRLTEQQVRESLARDDRRVRSAALNYLAEARSPDTSIIDDVIAVVEQRGHVEAFKFSHSIADLAQNEKSLVWAIEQLKSGLDLPAEASGQFQYTLQNMLANSAPQLLRPHLEAIARLPKMSDSIRTKVERRMRLAETPSEQLWLQLEVLCEKGKSAEYYHAFDHETACDIASALGRDTSQAERMMEWLGQDADPNQASLLVWMEIFVAVMAGELRYAPAIPLLVRKLHVDSEILAEKCVESLVRIGSDEVIRAVGNGYPGAESHFRLYSTGVFNRIHSDLAVATGLELARHEQDEWQRSWLTNDLVGQFSTEAIDAARELVMQVEPEETDLYDSLIYACRTMNYEVPELAEWERDFPERDFYGDIVVGSPFSHVHSLDDRDDDYVEELNPWLEPEPVEQLTPVALAADGMKIGRNDLCLCGSGKKYKKCCLHKFQSAD